MDSAWTEAMKLGVGRFQTNLLDANVRALIISSPSCVLYAINESTPASGRIRTKHRERWYYPVSPFLTLVLCRALAVTSRLGGGHSRLEFRL
jgi:hypothetical protein